MRSRESSGWCRRCSAYQPLCRPTPDARKHAALSLATAGLWLPGWLGAWLLSRSAPWRCSRCGSRNVLDTGATPAEGLYGLYRPPA